MLQKQVSLAGMNTFGFDISAGIFFSVKNESQLQSLWKTNLFQTGHPLVLGGGSNILFTKDYPGIILKNDLTGRELLKETADHVLVRAGGGEVWHQLVLWAVENGWGGVENLSLIPGSVGAAPIQNIGAYGVEVEKVFHSLTAFDMLEGRMVEFSHTECRFGYRDSIFKHEGKGRYFITSVVLKLNKKHEVHTGYGDIAKTLEEQGITNPGISDISKAVIAIRQSKLPDPAVLGNCGSFFKNPVIPKPQFEELQKKHPDIRSFAAAEGFVKVPAAWLIETAGWKGFRRGDAGVHVRQALVLVNYGGATGAEIIALAKEIQQSVADTFGIALEMEVNVL